MTTPLKFNIMIMFIHIILRSLQLTIFLSKLPFHIHRATSVKHLNSITTIESIVKNNNITVKL